jgi:hypothetical protein
VRRKFFDLARLKGAPIAIEAVRQFSPHSPDNALSFGAACAIQI